MPVQVDKTDLIMADLNRQADYLNHVYLTPVKTSREIDPMDQLVYFNQKNKTQPVTNSRIVAKYFHKSDSSVRRTIRQAIKRIGKYNKGKQMFMNATFTKNNQKFPMYLITKDGFMLTVMSFTGEKAMKWKMKFINAFDYMYSHQQKPKFRLPQTYSAALRQLANKVDENHRLEQKKKQMTPTYDYGQAMSVGIKTSFTMKQAADQISKCFTGSIGRNKLMATLRYLHILCHGKSNWDLPREYYIQHKWFVIKHSIYHDNHIASTVRVTPKGIKGIIESIKQFAQAGVL